MVIKGRSRSNGVQLADYLLGSKENDRARIIDIRGTAQPNDLKRSLREMSLSSELTKRGKLGLYHAQVNPAIGEDRPMTHDDWLRAADLLEQNLGFDGQKRAIVLHEKNGRVHGHIVWERYDHDTGRLRSDSHNFKKHDQARAQIEQELGHDRTPQKADREPTDKERLTQLWQEHPEGASFTKAAQEAGYKVAQGNARRPFRVVTPDGQSLDLTRQLDGIKVKAVRDRLQPIRDTLPTEAEALQQSKSDRQQIAKHSQSVPEQSDNRRDLSDAQTLAAAMINRLKQRVETEKGQDTEEQAQPKKMSYSFTVQQPPPLPQEPEKKIRSDKMQEMSENMTAANDNEPDLLAKFRHNKEDDLLSKFRSQKREQTRPNERTREQDGLDYW